MWASLIKSETKCTNDTKDIEFKHNIPKPLYKVTRHKLKLYNTSYDDWEYNYFKHILNILQIIKSNKIITPRNDIELIFLFGQFLYEVSSGHISPYLEPINENLYKTYLIKRESYTKDE